MKTLRFTQLTQGDDYCTADGYIELCETDAVHILFPRCKYPPKEFRIDVSLRKFKGSRRIEVQHGDFYVGKLSNLKEFSLMSHARNWLRDNLKNPKEFYIRATCTKPRRRDEQYDE